MENDYLRDENRNLRREIERLRDMLIWVVEVHHEADGETLSELYEKFTAYENQEQAG